MTSLGQLLALLVTTALSSTAQACDPQTGARIQTIHAYWEAEPLIGQQRDGDPLVYFDLPIGYRLGVLARQAGPDVYVEQGQWRKYNVELVHLELYDARQHPPKRVAQTLAGANSASGFSEDFLPTAGGRGLILRLSKPLCVPTDGTLGSVN